MNWAWCVKLRMTGILCICLSKSNGNVVSLMTSFDVPKMRLNLVMEA